MQICVRVGTSLEIMAGEEGWDMLIDGMMI